MFQFKKSMERVFVSYKRDTFNLVQPLVKHIEESIGEKCWMDINGIETGKQFRSVICKAINESSIVLFMYSKLHLEIEDPDKDWTIKELNYAENKKKRIVVIRIDGTELDDVFLFDYGAMNNIDASNPVQVEKLIHDLKEWLSISPKPASKSPVKRKPSITSTSPNTEFRPKSTRQKTLTSNQLQKEKLTPSPNKEAQLWQKVKVSEGDYYVSLSKRGLKEQTIAFLSTLPGITTDLAENFYKITPVNFIWRISKQSALDIQRQIEILEGRADIYLDSNPKPATQTVSRSTPSRATPSWWGFSVVLKDMGEGITKRRVLAFLKKNSVGVSIPGDLNNSILPYTVAEGVSREKAESIKQHLESLGAKAYIA